MLLDHIEHTVSSGSLAGSSVRVRALNHKNADGPYSVCLTKDCKVKCPLCRARPGMLGLISDLQRTSTSRERSSPSQLLPSAVMNCK